MWNPNCSRVKSVAASSPAQFLPRTYPLKFWKVIAVVNGTGTKTKLATYGFVFDQSDVVSQFGIEFAPGAFARFQKKLTDITDLTGVVFDKSLRDADAKKSA